MASLSRALRLSAATALTLLLSTLPLARARASTAAVSSSTDPMRVRAMASVGGAIGGVGGYQGYGLGFLARAGVEVPLFALGGTRHALLAVVEGGRFSAFEYDTPFLFQGVQLDLASLRLDWRLYPWRGQGLYVDLGGGLTLARDHLEMVLPGRQVRSTQMRLGVPIELATGWVVADHVDISLRYSQIVFTQQAPASFGFMQLALGMRI